MKRPLRKPDIQVVRVSSVKSREDIVLILCMATLLVYYIGKMTGGI
jgi:hypothetical protein